MFEARMASGSTLGRDERSVDVEMDTEIKAEEILVADATDEDREELRGRLPELLRHWWQADHLRNPSDGTLLHLRDVRRAYRRAWNV